MPTSPLPESLEEVQPFHEATCRLIVTLMALCQELRDYRILACVPHELLPAEPKSKETGVSRNGLLQARDALLLRLEELSQQFANLKRHTTTLDAFAIGSQVRDFQDNGRSGSCLAGVFVARQRKHPPASLHAAGLDLAAGCLDELRNNLRTNNDTDLAAGQWYDAFLKVGRSSSQWCLALNAERLRAKNPFDDLTVNERHQKFCFDRWQEGWSHKEINAGLKQRGWQPYPDPRSVRAPINAWGQRIGVTPRPGQPGRRKTT